MGGCLAYARQVPRWPYFVLKSYYTFQARLESLGSPGWSQMLSDLPVGLPSARIPCVRIMPMLCQFVFEDKLSQSWPGRPWTWNPSSAWARAGVTQVHYSVWLHIVFLICLHPNIHRRKWFHTFISTLQLYHITQCREMSQGFYCFGVGEPNAVLSFFFFFCWDCTLYPRLSWNTLCSLTGLELVVILLPQVLQYGGYCASWTEDFVHTLCH